MARVISILNPKGGVGKTTTAVNLAALLALAGKRTLLVDLDPQAGATSGLGLPRATSAQPLRFLVDDEAPAPALSPTIIAGLEVLASGPPLAELEPLLWRREDRHDRLRRALGPLRERFEFVLVDSPPAAGILPLNALVASDSAIVPVPSDPAALVGLGQVFELLRRVRKRFNPGLEVEGLLLTLYGEPLERAREVELELRAFFREAIFSTVIPRDEALAEAARQGRPVVHQSCSARGAYAYVELAKEVMGP